MRRATRQKTFSTGFTTDIAAPQMWMLLVPLRDDCRRNERSTVPIDAKYLLIVSTSLVIVLRSVSTVDANGS